MKIKKGDTVQVIVGEYKGKVGQVLHVLTKENRVVVDGVNVVTRHMRPSQNYPDGGLIKNEAPIHISNVAIVDPKTNVPTKVGMKIVDGKKVRYAKASGTVLDK